MSWRCHRLIFCSVLWCRRCGTRCCDHHITWDRSCRYDVRGSCFRRDHCCSSLPWLVGCTSSDREGETVTGTTRPLSDVRGLYPLNCISRISESTVQGPLFSEYFSPQDVSRQRGRHWLAYRVQQGWTETHTGLRADRLG